MKIELAESLVYSWLRHIKECQIVQTNWKTSPAWTMYNQAALEGMFNDLNTLFGGKGGVKTFKKTTDLSQLLQQGECDVIGVSIQKAKPFYYAVDVAFHESGLNYGSKQETIYKVLAKCIRTAFCLYGYFNATDGEIYFASPKIPKPIETELDRHIATLNTYFLNKGLNFKVALICNDDFNNLILDPVLIACKGVADTSELFARAYKLIDMFAKNHPSSASNTLPANSISVIKPSQSAYATMRVGTIARTALRSILENGNITKSELADMQDKGYSKTTFGLSYPLLSLVKAPHYYSAPLTIGNRDYYLCCEWYDRNKDKLIDWIINHP